MRNLQFYVFGKRSIWRRHNHVTFFSSLSSWSPVLVTFISNKPDHQRSSSRTWAPSFEVWDFHYKVKTAYHLSPIQTVVIQSGESDLSSQKPNCSVLFPHAFFLCLRFYPWAQAKCIVEWHLKMMTPSKGTFSALLNLCAGNSSVTGEFPSKCQWRGALMFSLICAWVSNRDWRRHLDHYDITVMNSMTSVANAHPIWLWHNPFNCNQVVKWSFDFCLAPWRIWAQYVTGEHWVISIRLHIDYVPRYFAWNI